MGPIARPHPPPHPPRHPPRHPPPHPPRHPPPHSPPHPPPHPRRCSGSSLLSGVVDHHSNAPNKKVGITSIRRRTYYSRRCKMAPASNIDPLPNEVLIEILVRLSAEEICENARFVCRNWYHIIHSDAFINAHRHHHRDSWRLLLINALFGSVQLFLAKDGRIEISKLYYKEDYFPHAVSCNGLVLWMEFSDLFTINIHNLVTEQTFGVPQWKPRGEIHLRRFGIGYAAASMVYKVVRTYKRYIKDVSAYCSIITAGVDRKWRRVVIDDLSCGAKKLLIDYPLITQGFMHWTCGWGTHVLTLNVETEMFTESHVPITREDGDRGPSRRRLCYLSTGRRLSLLYPRGYWMWEVWEMEGESGEWRQPLPNINLEGHKWRIERDFAYQNCDFLVPLGWVKYPVLLALCFCGGAGSTCILYNLDTDEIDSIELYQPCLNYMAVVHRNTLEWLS